MKKICLCLLIVTFLLTGCNSTPKEEINELEYNLYNSYFKVAEPYKKAIIGNYITNKIGNRYDLNEVETGLMRITSKYYSNNKYFYQSGQFFTREDLNNLLSDKNLNNVENIVEGNINFKPKYVTYIHEQNYLNRNQELEVIALAIVLNPYQEYLDENGVTRIKIIDEKILYNHGIVSAQKLLDYTHGKTGLENIKMVIGMYFQNKPNAVIPGNYHYEAKTNKKIDDFNAMSEKYYLLPSNDAAATDNESSNSFIEMEKKLKELFSTISMSGTGLYNNGILKELELNVQTSYISKNEVLAISQLLSQSIVTKFDKNLVVQITVKNDSNVEAIISKGNNELNCQIYLIN